MAMAQNNSQQIILHQPKNDIEARHRVVKFGKLFEADFGEDPDEEKLYRYHHQRQDLRQSKGSIPVGFESYIPLREGHNLYLETRKGGFSEDGLPVGPEYRISWKLDREVLGAGDGDGWSSDLDDLWTRVLAQFEHKNLLSEDTLFYLDADPFVLFGIDDLVTQQALRKLEKFPHLRCEASVPTFEEWADYLRVDPFDSEMKWVVQAFLETELPIPWTCYKGVGSIVCYIRSDTGQATWKHPLYDYFRQLRDFCIDVQKNGRPEEIMRVRVNRLLWTYDATRVETAQTQEPLLSPEYVSRLADVFGYDVKQYGCIVRNLKAQLTVFARSYRERQDVDLGDIINCAELIQRDVDKHAEMVDHWLHHSKEEIQFDLHLLSNGELQCVNCGAIAQIFVLDNREYLCHKCFGLLYSKGSRQNAAAFKLVSCDICVNQPAKLQCTFTDKSICNGCYAMHHIKQLPPAGRENPPRKIDYYSQYERFAEFHRKRFQNHNPGELPALENEGSAYEAVLSTDWHPFHDAQGTKFYHNFVTGERMRQSPHNVPNNSDPGAEAEEMTSTKPKFGRSSTMRSSTMGSTGNKSARSTQQGGSAAGGAAGKTAPLPLEGFDALETSPKARAMAASQPDMRTLRPPFRKSQPCETAAL